MNADIRRRNAEARRREQAEQQRLAEQRRQEQTKDRQRREEQIRHNARVASLESQWAQFSRNVAHGHRQQMRQAFFQRLDSVFNEIDAYFNPPPPAPEPTIVVVQEDDGSADLGSRNFDVNKWAAKPKPWFQ